MSNSQFNKLKARIKNGNKVTLKLSSNAADDSNYENGFLDKLLLTNAQTSKLCKVFAENSSANMKLSKTQLHKIGQSGGSLGRCLGPLLKTGLLLMKNAIESQAKNVLVSLGLTAAASATDAAQDKKILGSCRPLDLTSRATTIIISYEEMNDIMKIIKYLEESGLMIKGVEESIKNEQMMKKKDFSVCF